MRSLIVRRWTGYNLSREVMRVCSMGGGRVNMRVCVSWRSWIAMHSLRWSRPRAIGRERIVMIRRRGSNQMPGAIWRVCWNGCQ